MIEKFILNANLSSEKLKEINRSFIYFKGTYVGSTVFPLSSQPMNTYGEQIMQFAYNPVSTNSIIRISPIISLRAEQSYENRGVFAVFINDNVYSQCAGYTYLPYADSLCILTGIASYNNNSLDQIIIKVRAGLTGAVTNFTFNPYLNQNTSSSLTVTEYQV